MEPAKILRANYLDIIFDQRNKKYGGYELRQHYNRRVGKAVSFLLLGVGAFASFSFITSRTAERTVSREVVIAPRVIDITPSKPMPKPVIPPKPSAPPQHISTRSSTEPVIAPDEMVRPEQLPNVTNTAVPGVHTSIGDSTGIAEAPVTGMSSSVVVQPPAATNKPLVWVEQMPQFMGDREAYMNAHVNYPELARTTNIEGRVIIVFVVNEDGSVSDVKVQRGIGGGCDDEALRMVSGMPKWKPGKQNGKPVKVLFSLSVNFELK